MSTDVMGSALQGEDLGTARKAGVGDGEESSGKDRGTARLAGAGHGEELGTDSRC